MDGTFGVVPCMFSQLYTLHALYRGQMVPLVFFLLPDKLKPTYARMFTLLRNYAASLGLLFNTTKFQLDFEISTLQAVRELFPLAEIKGCNFHFDQCLFRKVQEEGLTVAYRDVDVKAAVRAMAALAFVPLHRIDEAWLEIEAESLSPDHEAFQNLERFKTYFVDTWLENECVYPRSLWNHFRNYGPCTTNHLEGWHRALNHIVGKKHVDIFRIITHLQKQEELFKKQMMLLRREQDPPRPRKKYVKINRRLTRFANELESNQTSLMEYVRNVGSNLKL